MLPREYYETVIARIPGRDSETLERQALECLRYLAIMSLTPGRRVVVDPDVDDVWHEFIVQTRSYRDLCESLPGHRFINHESITPDHYAERVGDGEFVDEFLRWIPDYVHNFGPFDADSHKHWTVVAFLMETVGMSLQEINELGESSEPEVRIPLDSPWQSLRGNEITSVLEPA
jgi:hypothetical protein